MMTEKALNLALKLVIRHDELENVNQGVLRDALVDILETQILFHWIGLKKLAYNIVHYHLRYQRGWGRWNPPPPYLHILDEKRPTRIRFKSLRPQQNECITMTTKKALNINAISATARRQ